MSKPCNTKDADTPCGAEVLSKGGGCGRSNNLNKALAPALPDSEILIIPAVLTSGELASVLDVPAATVRQEATNGTIPKIGRNQYPARAGIAAYVSHLRERLARRENVPDEIRLLKARANEREHKAEAARFAAREAKRRCELLEGKAIDRDIIRALLIELVSSVRSRLLAIPSVTAAQLADVESPRKCFAILTSAIHEALSDLSSADASAVLVEAVQKHRESVRREVPPAKESAPDDADADAESDL